MNIRNRIFDKTVEVSELPGRPDLPDLLLQSVIERRRGDELDLGHKHRGRLKDSVGSTHERVTDDAVLLKNGHGEREVILNDILDESIVRMLLLAIMSDSVFQRLCLGHFDSCWWISCRLGTSIVVRGGWKTMESEVSKWDWDSLFYLRLQLTPFVVRLGP